MSIAVIEEAKLSSTGQYAAKRRYREYREAVEAGRDCLLDRELMHAYHQLGMGRIVISLNRAMENGGCNHKAQPVLAIARASARTCFFEPHAGWLHDQVGGWHHAAVAFVSELSQNPGWRQRYAKASTWTGCYRFPARFFPGSTRELRGQVPLVPPRLRPKASLENYTILWEAAWEEAPGDPYLLRRVTKDLFVVLASWNLTDTEKVLLESSRVAATD